MRSTAKSAHFVGRADFPPQGPLWEACRQLAVHGAAVVPIESKDEWSGQLLLVDPGFGAKDVETLQFLAELVEQTSPAIRSVYLFRRLRSRIGVMERARLSRELHDGAIQTLIAAEMDLEVIRRRSRSEPVKSEDLLRVQEVLRTEVAELRRLMHQLRPMQMSPSDLVSFLTELVDRFRRETGIAARLLCDDQNPLLPPAIAREVAQITREALVNVRKHAKARNVLVRFGSENGAWTLVVHDDGQGFGFSGRISGDDPGGRWKAPQVLRERVKKAHGELTLESGPGLGARLEIKIPKPYLN